jgi:hypothetical protein
MRTCDEFASFIDILYCQIEQLIRQANSQAHYIFDNESIVIVLIDDFNQQAVSIDEILRLSIDLARFIDYVNQLTQWSLTYVIGIDTNSIDLLTTDCIEGDAYECARWLGEQCQMSNRIHVSSRIYNQLNNDQAYIFETHLSTGIDRTYLVFHLNMSKAYEYEQHRRLCGNTSDMIDQLTRIQTESYVGKHLGTITLTRSLRKRSLFRLTSNFMSWLTLSWKDSSLHDAFNSTDRYRQASPVLIDLGYIFILLASILQSFTIDRLHWNVICFCSILIVGLGLVVRLTTNMIEKYSRQHRTISNYVNMLACSMLVALLFGSMQYHAVRNDDDDDDLFSTLSSINRTAMDLNRTDNR